MTNGATLPHDPAHDGEEVKGKGKAIAQNPADAAMDEDDDDDEEEEDVSFLAPSLSRFCAHANESCY